MRSINASWRSYSARQVPGQPRILSWASVANRAGHKIPRELLLAVDCPIVVTRNRGGGVVNGTQGMVIQTFKDRIVVRLQNSSTTDITYTDFPDPADRCTTHPPTLFRYLPVILGYALTIHRAQGMCLQLAEVDLKGAFAHGHAYTALSLVADRRGLVVKNMSPGVVKCHDEVREFYGQLDNA